MGKIKRSVRAYYIWLLEKSGLEKGLIKRYSKTLEELFRRPFYWKIAHDENRITDVFELRNEYVDGLDEESAEEFLEEMGGTEATLLELIIVLALSAEFDIMHDDDVGDRTGFWFWCMMQNAGFDKYDNEHFDRLKVDLIASDIVDRHYKKNGTGGLFLAQNYDVDMRKTELWYQLNYWLRENF